MMLGKEVFRILGISMRGIGGWGGTHFITPLSESALHSDSTTRIPSFSVRISPPFGLNYSYSLLLCQNQYFIWTQATHFLTTLSQSALYSDSTTRIPYFSVRINPSFGLNYSYSLLLCQNQYFIWTQATRIPYFSVRINTSFGLKLLTSWLHCQNQPFIRTIIKKLPFTLSKSLL